MIRKLICLFGCLLVFSCLSNRFPEMRKPSDCVLVIKMDFKYKKPYELYWNYYFNLSDNKGRFIVNIDPEQPYCIISSLKPGNYIIDSKKIILSTRPKVMEVQRHRLNLVDEQNFIDIEGKDFPSIPFTLKPGQITILPMTFEVHLLKYNHNSVTQMDNFIQFLKPVPLPDESLPQVVYDLSKYENFHAWKIDYFQQQMEKEL